MASFLTPEFFDDINTRLAAVSAPRPDAALIVVFDFSDGPSHLPHAMTLIVSPSIAELAVGDHLGANLVVRLSYDDGAQLAEGTLDTVRALREGRMKVRGDVNTLLEVAPWLAGSRA